MKRWIRCLASFLVIGLLLSILPVSALAASMSYTDKYGTWTYQIEADGSVTIIGCKNAKKNIVIPSVLDGKPVKKLGDGLFKDNDTITAVIIPHGVTQIGANVFSGCAKLEQIDLPPSLVSIGDEAFSECTKLTGLYIPSSVTDIGNGVFKDNPQLNVTCAIDSAAAAYLEKNRTELGSYTLIKVAPSKQEPQEPQTNVTQEPVINGKLVTYAFGKMMNGKREFTLVVADSMPDLDLAEFLVYNEDDDFYRFDEQLYDLMQNRFQLVSLSRFDGTSTQKFVCNEQDAKLFAYPSKSEYTENGETRFTLEYHLSIPWKEADLGIFPENIEFNDDNELVEYSVYDYDGNTSTVKEDEQYTKYYQNDNTFTYFLSDGSQLRTHDYKSADAHRFGVKGTCVEIGISYNKRSDSDGSSYESDSKRVSVYDGETGTKTHANHYQREFEDGPIGTDISSGYYKVEEGVRTEEKNSSSYYDEQGDLMRIHQSEYLPGREEGTYEVTNANLAITNEWETQHENHWTDSDGNFVDTHNVNHHEEYNNLYYRETVVRADNVKEAVDRTFAHFPNDPDEHTYDVSERKIDSVDLVKWEETETNLNTGEVTKYSGSYKYEELSDHTYVGDTGKYVGWDWSWAYNVEEEKTTLTGYTVTEYTYTTEGDRWTKTTVYVSPTENSDGTYDFKTTFPKDLLESYNMNSSSYVFDDSLESESGMDHWQETEHMGANTYEGSDGSPITNKDYVNESENINLDVTDGVNWVDGKPISQEEAKLLEEKLGAAEAIVLGNTTVTAGKETISQEESKEDMLDLMEELKEPANYQEDFFEEVLEKIVPDGQEILAELEQGTLPESNVENPGEIQCPNHSDSLPAVNEEAATETPAADSTVESAAEPTSENIEAA